MGTEVKRIACNNCIAIKGDTSRENLSVYKDGSKYCWACGYVEQATKKEQKKGKEMGIPLIPGIIVAFPDRGLTEETCAKYRVKQINYTGILCKGTELQDEIVRIYPIHQDGKVVKQKIKVVSDKKQMGQFGETSCLGLFGQNAFSPHKKIPVIVTEGEEDAMAAFQMTGLPAVSITRGAEGGYKELEANLTWLSEFKEVLLCLDMDTPGREATDDCIKLFEPGTVKSVQLPVKDANEMLLKGSIEEFKKCLWNAVSTRPKTIIFPKDIRDKILTKPTYGLPWPWQSMTKATYGMRLGEVYLLAAATSVGKTELMQGIISYFLNNDCKVGNFSFEQQPAQTIQRYIGAALKLRLHIPGEDWPEEEITKELDKLEEMIALYAPDSGHVALDAILTNIRYLYKCHKISFFVIDNLKAMASHPVIDGKRVAVHDYASHCMSMFVMIAKELNINIFVLNHLASDKISLQAYVSTSPKNPTEYLGRTAEEMNSYINKPGLTWETGRMPGIENIFGGGAIKDLTDYIIVLARNRMSDDPEEHRTLRVKFLKTRLDSNYEGFEFRLVYDYDTGRLIEPVYNEATNRIDVARNDTYTKEENVNISKILG